MKSYLKGKRRIVLMLVLIATLITATAVLAAGAAMRVVDIWSGSSSGYPRGQTVYNGELYFQANGNDGAGAELWKYNSTTNIASRVADIYSGSTGSSVNHLAVYNGELYFRANGNDGAGNELWKYNSATDTASRVVDIYSGSSGGNPLYLAVYNGELYFRANGGDGFGDELWKYNSVTDTATRVTDIRSGSGHSFCQYMTVYNGDLYFQSNDGSGIGIEFWKYNSGSGATLVDDLNSGAGSSSPSYLVVHNGELYFRANGGDGAGRELWKYNSITDTSSRVADIWSGSGNGDPAGLTLYNGEIFFRANGNDGAGTELWKYNSTTDTASRAADIHSSGSGSPFSFAVYDNNLYFHANGGDGAGFELWMYDAIAPVVTSTSLSASYAVGPTSFTATFSEDVSDAGAGANPDDVTNPANYLLVEEGANAAFDTASCIGGLAADDTQITVDSVTYNSGTYTATVNINGGAPLPSGSYRLFICGTTSIVDLPGNPINDGADYTFDFAVDDIFPVVASTSLAASYTIGPMRFTATFSEDVSDAGGGGDPDDVTNPANYLLVEDGVNGVFDTASCRGGLAVDDAQITVNGVTYNSGTDIATVKINSATALPNGSYRLFICGTTSIVDLFGNPLNGGADYTFDFDVQRSPPSLPATGFTPGRVSHLPQQPASKVYTSTRLVLEIPSLSVQASIVWVPQSDESWDVTWLGRNVGYLSGSAFPTWRGNTVITGHVWDARNRAGPFAKLKSLKFGDQFYIHAWGEEYDWVTLLTCELYNPLSGNYFFRRVVRAVLVDVRLE
jgi:ELWxxDGT repeat protein